MSKNPGTYGNDLAADLLADLAQPLPLDRLAEPPNPLSALDSVESAAPRETPGRGPAIAGSLRISPLDWRKPSMSIGLASSTILFGPVRARLGVRVA